MLQRGARSIIGIGRIFKIMDDNGDKSLDIAEFDKAVHESKLDFTDVDTKALFQAFDRNGDGTIDFDEFLRAVKGDMNPARVRLVNQAFDKIDIDDSGELDYEDIKDTYNAKKHPAVLEGRKTERQVLEEFLSTFELHLSGVSDGRVTREEFLEYYTNISASIDNEEYFAQMMNSSWNLDNQASQYKKYDQGVAMDNTKKATGTRPTGGSYGGTMKGKPTGKATMASGVQSADNPFATATAYYADRAQPARKSLAYTAPKHGDQYGYTEAPGQQSAGSSMGNAQNSQVYQQHVAGHQGGQDFPQPDNRASVNAQGQLEINRFKERLASRGAKGLIGLKKQFALIDIDGSGAVDLHEFQEMLDNFKIPGISASDAQRLFNVFDHDRSGDISFEEFLTTLCGDFPAHRRRIVQLAFEKLDADKSGTLELDEVKADFDPSRHPDVIAGLKTIEEARFGFFEMFGSFHNAEKRFTGDKSVSPQEFMEYHHYLNEGYERDNDFQNFVVGVWNLDRQEVGHVAGKHPDQWGKNSREQWKYENHKILYGDRSGGIIGHEPAQGNGGRPQREHAEPSEGRSAGGRTTLDFGANKGIAVQGEMGQRREAAQQQKQFKYTSNEELIKRVRDKIKARGARGIVGIGKSFKIIDDDGSGALDSQEFSKALRDYRISNDPREHQAIFEAFDPDGNG